MILLRSSWSLVMLLALGLSGVHWGAESASAEAGLGLPPVSFEKAERKLFNFDFFSAEAAFEESEADPKNREYKSHTRYLRLGLLLSLSDGLEDLVAVMREGKEKATPEDKPRFEKAIKSLSRGVDEYYDEVAAVAARLGEDGAEWEIVLDIRLNYNELPKPGLTEEALRAGTYKAEFETEEYLTYYCADSFIAMLDATVETVRGYNANYVSYSGQVDLPKAVYLAGETCREHGRYKAALACYETVRLMGAENKFDKYGRLSESAINLMRRNGQLPAE